MSKYVPAWAVDLVERSVATFAQAFLAVEIVDQNGVNQPESLKIAAVAGALAVGKFLLAKANVFLKSSPPPAA